MSYPSPIFYKMGEGFPFACLPDFIKKCPLPVASATCFSLSARYNKNINAIGEKSRYCYEETSCAFAFALLGCRTVCRMRKHAHPAEDDSTTTTPEEPVTVRLGGLKGPTSMGMVKLLSDNDAGKTTNHYEFSMAGSADELTPKMLQGTEHSGRPCQLGLRPL